MKTILIATCVSMFAFASVSAATITQWNFNSNPPDTSTGTGSTSPSVGSGTASLFGGTTATFASGTANGGSTDPATADQSGWNITAFAAQGGAARGVQFNVSTLGFESVIVGWDQRFSNTSSQGTQFQFSTDGTTFTTFGTLGNATAGDTWINNRSVDLTSIAAASDNANFAFRILQLPTAANGTDYIAATSTSPYAGAGTWRFDMVTVSGTALAVAIPEPGSIAVLSIACVAGAAGKLRKRRATGAERTKPQETKKTR